METEQKAGELEQYILAYYLAHGAQNLEIAGRFYTRLDLVGSIGDKIKLGTRKFGREVTSRAVPVAKMFLQVMIERGAFTTVEQKIGADMHQFQSKIYRQVLRELEEDNEIIRRSRVEGEDFWANRFASLTG